MLQETEVWLKEILASSGGGVENCIKEFEIDSGENQVVFSVFCKMRSCWSVLEMRKLELYSADNVVEPQSVRSCLCPDAQEALPSLLSCSD